MKRKYTFGSKLGYALTDILGGGSFALISLLFLNFLVTMEGISPALAGAVVMVGKIWDAVTDPLMGMLSDRTRSRFGRRRIYLLIGVIPIILTFTMLWYSFGISGITAKFIYYCVAYCLFSTAYTVVTVPYNALLPDMVEGYENRTGYSTLRILISNLSATISVTVPNIVLGPEASRTTGSYLVMGLLFGCFFGLPLLIGFFSTWENPVRKEDMLDSSLKAMYTQFKNSFRNRAYRQYLGIFCFGQMGTDVFTTMSVFWLTDIIHKPGMITLMSGVVMVVGVCALPVYNWMAKRYGKHYPAFLCLPLRVVALLISLLLGPDTSTGMLVAIGILMGLGSGASSFVPWSLLPDLPDSDEMMTGKRNAGIYAGMSTFVRKFTSGVGIFLVGVVLQLFGYVESSAGETVAQTATALFGIKFMYSIVTSLLTLVAVWLGARYALTKPRHSQVLQAIEHKRETGQPTADPAVIDACEKVAGHPFNTMWAGQAKDE